MTHRARISPLSSTLIIFGVLFFAVAGPIGVALLVAAWLVQRNYRAGILGQREAVAQQAREKARDRQLAAARNF